MSPEYKNIICKYSTGGDNFWIEISQKKSNRKRSSIFPPKLEILVFASDDIITTSLTADDESTDRVANKIFSGKIYWDD